MLTKARTRRHGFGALLVAIAVVTFVCIPFAQGQTAAPATQPVSFTYDVVSIKAHPPDAATSWGMGSTVDGFSGTNLTVKMLIFNAYDLRADDQLIGLPKWANSDSFDIQAKMDDDVAAAFHKLSREEGEKQRRLMMQQLLADRFQLKVHHEMKELSIYNLVVSKSGPKLKEPAADAKGSTWWTDGQFSGDRAETALLVYALSHELSRTVIDKTRLTGQYAISLKWTPENKQETADSGPSIFAALDEQLGLKLESAKGPVDTVVVDHIERPGEN
jgi:uncharacterized protein (TIGR03435 family)